MQAAKTTVFEMAGLHQLKADYTALQKRMDTKRAGMVKLHIMGYGGPCL